MIKIKGKKLFDKKIPKYLIVSSAMQSLFVIAFQNNFRNSNRDLKPIILLFTYTKSNQMKQFICIHVLRVKIRYIKVRVSTCLAIYLGVKMHSGFENHPCQ